jgi:pyruvate/2-oxoacid:ferredoxin oxidoreductase beta subunit
MPKKNLKYALATPILEKLDDELQTRGIGMCPGCGEELAIRYALRVMGKNTMVFTAPGCSPSALAAGTDKGSTLGIPSMGCYMTNLPPIASGVKRYLKRKGQDVNIICIAGDGVSGDVGFQPLSGAAERGENIIYMCLDNEAYMNTGIQRSGSTPRHSWTTTTPVGKAGRGKPQLPKYLPLLMALHGGVSYAATATPYHMEDFVNKLMKAKSVTDGMAYLHVLAACPTGWRAPADRFLHLSKLAVETNYFPIWESSYGQFRFTITPKKVKPITAFTSGMGRFKHFTEEEIETFQDMVDARYEQMQLQCSRHTGNEEKA